MIRIVFVTLGWVVAIACSRDSTRVAESRPQSEPVARRDLEPYPNSRVLRSTNQDGFAGVEYEVSVPYPAEPLIAFIESRVPTGFRPRKEDFLNPGIPTSHVRGWTGYGDLTTQPHSWIHRWSAEWEDPAGNILSYDLMYRSPASTGLARPTTDQLHVRGNYFPRELVDRLRSTVPQNAGVAWPSEDAAHVVLPTKEVPNRNYLVLRSVSATRTPGSEEAILGGQTLYFEAEERLLDLQDFDLETVEESSGPAGNHVVLVHTNASGARKLGGWTRANIGRQLGIFLDGRLISAPRMASAIDSMVVLEGEFSKADAARVAARLHRGGAD